MKSKQIIFWFLLVFIALGMIEATLRLYFYQIDSKYPLAIMRTMHMVKNNIVYNFLPEKPIGIWQNDPRFGYSHIANSHGIHETPDFKVSYTIGPDKDRYILKPTKPIGKLLFLGGSYTFGHGVNDDENYPYILSTYWQRWSIVNKAVMGWGTSHAYQTLLDEIDSENPPSVVIYSMINHHIIRNFARKSWVSNLAKYQRNHSYYDLVDNNLIFKGVVNESTNLVDPPDIENKELALTNKFLGRMQEICLEHNIKFVVILLSQSRKHPFPVAIHETLIDNKISTLDLTALKIRGFEMDEHHPNPNDHRHIADAIASSFIPNILSTIIHP
jgi:hypothetical protein